MRSIASPLERPPAVGWSRGTFHGRQGYTGTGRGPVGTCLKSNQLKRRISQYSNSGVPNNLRTTRREKRTAGTSCPDSRFGDLSDHSVELWIRNHVNGRNQEGNHQAGLRRLRVGTVCRCPCHCAASVNLELLKSALNISMNEAKAHIDIPIGSERGFAIVFTVVFSLLALQPLLNGGNPRSWMLIAAGRPH